jgi:hypothetical protein
MIAAAARISGGRKFDQWEERQIPLYFTGRPSRFPMALPDIRSKAVAAVDQAIGRKDE